MKRIIHYKNIFYLLVIFIFTACSYNDGDRFYYSQNRINYKLKKEEVVMLDSIQHKAFLFFINERNPQNGLVKDRTASWAPASIASVGFAIPSYAVGIERGWLERKEAANFTISALQFFYNSVQSADTNATGYKGFYYHFLRMNSGTREWNCELSTVDTGLLIMGIIFARNYFNQDNDIENEIRDIAAKLIERMNWDFFQMPVSGNHPGSISMGWTPEEGMHNMGWRGYNEALFLYILAAGSGMKNIEAGFETWLSSYNWITPYPGLSHAAFPPLFGHIFSFCFLNPKELTDSYMREKEIDYYENSRRAVYVQREYAIENPQGWNGYDSLCWGISACDGPGDSYNFNDYKFFGYAGRGTSGSGLVYFDDGTKIGRAHV